MSTLIKLKLFIICIFFILPSLIVRAEITQVDSARCAAMRARHVISSHPKVSCNRLAVVSFDHLGFKEDMRRGEIVVMDVLAQDVESLFRELLARRFPITSARPLEDFWGEDEMSMAADNTSAFNDRTVAGTSSISLHAYGAAIDINPVENPYISRARSIISPRSGEPFVSRTTLRPGMTETIVAVFATHGFTIWGGAWRDPKDYQHFQIDLRLAERLVALPREEAFRVYALHRASKTR